VEEGGLFEALARERLVEEAIHALLQVQQLVQRIPTERHQEDFSKQRKGGLGGRSPPSSKKEETSPGGSV
jgi:hypothetical protein